MPQRLNTSDAGFAAQLQQVLAERSGDQSQVVPVVTDILHRVKAEGDAAVLALTEQFDRIALTPETMRVTQERLDQARADCDPKVIAALEHAAARIRRYHEKQMPEDCRYEDEDGITLGWQWRSLEAVGLYVPGGLASYPSSVLMNAIPAKVAGCSRLVMVVPTPDGKVNPAIFVAAAISGVDEVYTIGGAQAVAALAYGTHSIAPVDKIVGPGNAFVAEAKRQLFGIVGIDTIAGPSEICVVADNKNDPRWIAADLLSQAEHDPVAQSILICDDAAFADAVCAAVDDTLRELPRSNIASPSWQEYGAVILCDDVMKSSAIIDAIAPEHLELAVENPDALAAQVRHAGAIFLGRYTPEAIGDYIAGPSHVLPTTRAARYSSGLSVYDFLKKSSLIGCSAEGAKRLISDAAALADSEGLGAHALSLRLRDQ
jgi:histidinol dehydrogenase